jgi:hypothetical protein
VDYASQIHPTKNNKRRKSMGVYDVTGKIDSEKTGFGTGGACDGPKGILTVGPGLRVAVRYDGPDGSAKVLGDPDGYPAGEFELMADIGSKIVFMPIPEKGFVSNRAQATVRIRPETRNFDQNFYASPASAQAHTADLPEFVSGELICNNGFIDQLNRIEEKMDRLMTAWGL